MDDELKELLKQVLANQHVIYNHLKIMQGGSKIKYEPHIVEELQKEADKILPHIKIQ